MKIKQKLMLTFGLLNAILFWAVVIITIFVANGAISKSLKGNLNGINTAVSNTVSNLFAETSKSFLFLNTKMASQSIMSFDKVLGQEKGKITFNNQISNSELPGYGYLYIIDNSNGEIVSKSRDFKSKVKADKNVKLSFAGIDLNYGLIENGENTLSYATFTYKPWDYTVVHVFKNLDAILLITPKIFNEKISDMKVGKRGYPFIIDKKGTFITHPELMGEDGIDLKDANGKEFIKEILKKKNDYIEYDWKNGNGNVEHKFARFQPIKNTEWIAVSSGYNDDFFSITALLKAILIQIAIVAVILNLIATIIISLIITKPISRFSNVIKDLSHGDGDLTTVIDSYSRDEMGTMAEYLNSFINKLRLIISDIKDTALHTVHIKNNLSSGTAETSAALQQITKSINEIEDRVHFLGTNMNSSNSRVDNISGNIRSLNGLIETQSTLIEQSTAAITEMTSSISSVADITERKRNASEKLVNTAAEGREVISRTQTAVEVIKEQLHSVKDMANLITDIASRTNLLSMNAAIEAAHAGDAGKGFAVVADEIRKLAESSSVNSTKIQEILTRTENAMEETDALSKESGKKFSHIDDEISEVVNAFNEIYTSTHELKAGGNELLDAIRHLRDSSLSVKEKSMIIHDDAGSVKEIMEDTRRSAEEVIIAITEINTGANEISRSMNDVTEHTEKIGETGDILHEHVNKFIC